MYMYACVTDSRVVQHARNREKGKLLAAIYILYLARRPKSSESSISFEWYRMRTLGNAIYIYIKAIYASLIQQIFSNVHCTYTTTICQQCASSVRVCGVCTTVCRRGVKGRMDKPAATCICKTVIIAVC